HLTTHAYFKALLFMCAGAVIHALGGEQDMRKMGGLYRKLPYTFWCFVASGLALAAIFPFAGFWSKDAILGIILQRAHSTSGAGWWILYAAGLATAALTGFYTFRLIFAVFFGRYRGPEITAAHATAEPPARADRRDPLAHVHEVGPAMAIPMGILAFLSIVGGFYGTPWNDAIGNFLQPVTGGVSAAQPGSVLFWIGIAAGLAVAILGILVAAMFFWRREPSFAHRNNPLIVFLDRRWLIDDLYDRAIVRPIVWTSGMLRRGIEGVTLDGGTRGVATVAGWISMGLRALQTGYARNYALAIFLGAALIVLYYVIHR
ncbi:MAG TPA: proton-conducting transporter membrane subunit, partial [Ktedonobacterales bacterium]|nr:proton-conducting transporter membrane subunit [Ktedonobacterales bacterium]